MKKLWVVLVLLIAASPVWAANEGDNWIPTCGQGCVETRGETIGGVSVPYGTVARLNAEDRMHIGEAGRGTNGGYVGKEEDYQADIEAHLAQNRANNEVFKQGMLQSAAQGVQDNPDDPIAQATLDQAKEFAVKVDQGTTVNEAQVRAAAKEQVSQFPLPRTLVSYEKDKSSK